MTGKGDNMESEFRIINGVFEEYFVEGEEAAIPEGVAAIDEYAFFDCENLKEINIPDSVVPI
ncbi:MAG: leucine-rich repeat domain-containing protein [Ruminococcus sp.]|nr:leucine-rich repeat domain-containing protein [Ruminococcus sp.]